MLKLTLTIFTIFFLAISPVFAQEQGRNVRIEYEDAAEMPNHIPFQSVIYSLNHRADLDWEATIRRIQKYFGETSEADAIAILGRIQQTITAMEQDVHTLREKLLCGHGSLQSKETYYQRLDALTNARIGNRAKHYTDFIHELSKSQSDAFIDYLISRKEGIQYQVSEYKSSYENSNYDVREVITKVCAEYGVEL